MRRSKPALSTMQSPGDPLPDRQTGILKNKRENSIRGTKQRPPQILKNTSNKPVKIPVTRRVPVKDRVYCHTINTDGINAALDAALVFIPRINRHKIICYRMKYYTARQASKLRNAITPGIQQHANDKSYKCS